MPWKRHILAFLALAVIGLAIWVATTPAVAGWLFGEVAYVAAYSFPLLRLYGLPLLALFAAVAGYLLPRGFWLWGAAVFSLKPAADAALTLYQTNRGVLETSQLWGLVLVDTVILMVLALACTVAAGLGAGLWLLWWWLRGDAISDRLGIKAANDGTA